MSPILTETRESAPTRRASAAPTADARAGTQTGAVVAWIGEAILRYGLVVILLYLGSFKFTATEAERIRPFIEHSPLLGWLYAAIGVQGTSNLIGSTELAVAILLAVRPLAARATALGSILGMCVFLTTLSFLVTTPGAWERVPDFFLPVPTLLGAFLLKDLFLLGAAAWSAGEALQASH